MHRGMECLQRKAITSIIRLLFTIDVMLVTTLLVIHLEIAWKRHNGVVLFHSVEVCVFKGNLSICKPLIEMTVQRQ